MKIVDDMGKYILEVDTERHIVYEKPMGYWKPDDVERYHNDFINKIIPLLSDKSWAKCVELREYKTSMITEDLQDHVKWAARKGFSAATIITDKENHGSVIEMQMHIAVRGLDLELRAFSSREACYQWLETKGF